VGWVGSGHRKWTHGNLYVKKLKVFKKMHVVEGVASGRKIAILRQKILKYFHFLVPS